VSPYCDEHGGYVLNATIDRYAYATIRPLDEPILRFIASDQQIQCECELDDPLKPDGTLDLHKAAYRQVFDTGTLPSRRAMEVVTFCDAPAGSGLGSSSTLVVAMIRAYAELLNLALDDYALARVAHRIERVDCGLQGGRQDQYSAAFGGINFMEFYANERAVVNTLRIKHSILCELEASLVLFYTGVSRESSAIIADQAKNLSLGSTQTIDAMHGLKREAHAMKECLLKGDFNGIVRSMQLGWESKKRTSRTVSNERLDHIYEASLAAGASAGKVSGAGGGGFLMLLVPPEKRMRVIQALQSFEGQASNCHFTKHGAQGWRL